RGVFAAQPINPGAFVLEYRGKLISAEECQSRLYTERESTFLFEFQWQNPQWCIFFNLTTAKIVGTEEFPAARVESSTALIEEISRDQDGSIQVGTEEFPAARVESSTALTEEISRDQDGSI
ncbi:hypothetical protein DNTS_004216, partial [Danionella cerebrum]